MELQSRPPLARAFAFNPLHDEVKVTFDDGKTKVFSGQSNYKKAQVGTTEAKDSRIAKIGLVSKSGGLVFMLVPPTVGVRTATVVQSKMG